MKFFPTDDLKTVEVCLQLDRTCDAQPEKNWVPAYYFSICLPDGTKIGQCDLRIGHNDRLYIGGNIGYEVDEAYRGHHYAAKACKLLLRHLSDEDIMKCAEKLNMPPDDFKAQYLHQNQEGSYDTNHKPCDFLQKDGSCLLGDYKPVNCAEFPYTARPDRWASLLGIVSNASPLRGLLIQSHDAPKMHPDGWVWVHRLIVCIVAV